jgi:alpha-galactosidase
VARAKVVVVGAGSAEFGIDSLAGLMRTKGLRGIQLALVDIDRDKLEIVERLARRMNDEWGAEMEVIASPNRLDVLEGAEFVILSVAVDREESWRRDHELARSFGITHYAENGGPGGFAHACRNLALVVPLLRDIEALAPDATLLVLTNPLTRICTAAARLSRIRCIGICHGIGIGYFILATALHRELGIELPSDPRFLWRDDRIEDFEAYQRIAKARYAIKAAGINHFTWILGVHDRDTGEDVYPHLRERMMELPARFEPLTQALFRLYGLVPVQGDTHLSEYVPFVADAKEKTWERFDIQLYDFEWSNRRRASTLRWMQNAAEGREDLGPLIGADSERVEYVIDGILNDRRGYEEAVNLPNGGCISNLPPAAIVEVPGIVDAEGVSGLHVGALPESIAALCRTQLTIDELTVEAFVSGDRGLVRQLFSIDPMIQDIDVAIRLADRVLEQNIGYLPQFG